VFDNEDKGCNMTEIEKFERQQKKALTINQRIAALEGAQEEIKKQLKALNVDPDRLQPTLDAMKAEADVLRAELADKSAKLAADIEAAEKVLNDGDE